LVCESFGKGLQVCLPRKLELERDPEWASAFPPTPSCSRRPSGSIEKAPGASGGIQEAPGGLRVIGVLIFVVVTVVVLVSSLVSVLASRGGGDAAHSKQGFAVQDSGAASANDQFISHVHCLRDYCACLVAEASSGCPPNIRLLASVRLRAWSLALSVCFKFKAQSLRNVGMLP
jgi:hypothetical protein